VRVIRQRLHAARAIGPCMVSDEGACRIWWASGVRTRRELTMLNSAGRILRSHTSREDGYLAAASRASAIVRSSIACAPLRRPGWVRNCAGEVEILAQGTPEVLQHFGHALMTEAPPLARPRILSESTVAPELTGDFQIHGSEATRRAKSTCRRTILRATTASRIE